MLHLSFARMCGTHIFTVLRNADPATTLARLHAVYRGRVLGCVWLVAKLIPLNVNKNFPNPMRNVGKNWFANFSVSTPTCQLFLKSML
jgi:hypothetical protein